MSHWDLLRKVKAGPQINRVLCIIQFTDTCQLIPAARLLLHTPSGGGCLVVVNAAPSSATCDYGAIMPFCGAMDI